jgi:superfamily II DNA helicase RecQ
MPSSTYIPTEMLACLKRYWGYTRFRPWQEETILAILDDQESIPQRSSQQERSGP